MTLITYDSIEDLARLLGADMDNLPVRARRRGGEAQQASLAEVKVVLDSIDNSVAGLVSYDDWINTGIAVWGAVGEEGRDAWIEWSERSPLCGVQFDPADKWETFPSRPVAGFGALEIMAKRLGKPAAKAFDDGADLAVAAEAAEVGLGAPLEVIQQLVATWLARGWGRDFRYNVTRKTWLEFTGDMWVDSTVDRGFWLAAKWAREVATGSKTANNASFARGVAAFLQNNVSMVVRQGDMDRDPWVCGVPGGVLDLRTGKVRAARTRDMISRQLAAAPEGDCPRWKKFIAEATSGDREVADFLQRWFGYCLTGDVSQHTFFYGWGPGGNGKSLTLETQKAMMGGYGVLAGPGTFVKQKQRGHPEEIAVLAGSRLVVVPEISGGEHWNVDLLKEVTGNSKMKARFMYGSSFEFDVTFKIASAGNHQPAFHGGVNAAIERRFAYAEFQNQPAVVDTTLAEKFREEMPGIVAWALEGLMRGYAARGLERPATMKKAAAGFFAEVDPVLRWMDENLDKDGDARVKVADLFTDWMGFRQGADIHEFGSLRAFGKMLKSRGLIKTTTMKGIATAIGWKIKSPF